MMLVEIGLCVVLARCAERCDVGQSVFSLRSDEHAPTLTASWSQSPTVLFGAGLEAALAQDLATVREVRHVLVEHAEGNLLVWIALDNPTREVRERVFQKELALIEGFPEVDFDFNIVASMNRDARSLSTNARIIYSRP